MATVCLFQNVHVVRYWAVRECQLKINVANCNVSQQLDERDGCVAKPLTIDLLRITLSSIMTAEFRRGRLKIKLRAVLPGLGQALMMLYIPPTARLPGYEMATLKAARHTRNVVA